MKVWKEYFGHCNFDHGSKGMITVPAQGSLLTVSVQHWVVAELCMEKWSNTTTRLRACVWWFVQSEHKSQFPQWCHWPEAFFIGGKGKRILGKFLGCNSGASIPSNRLSLWTVRENILQTCSAPDWWDALCPLSLLQNVLQKWKKIRTQH